MVVKICIIKINQIKKSNHMFMTFSQVMLITSRRLLLKKYFAPVRYISYVQGQEPEPKIREYFYYVDHQGMLFLDDSKMKNFTSCFKEKKFLRFFFKNLKMNNTGRYSPDFPYVSLCGAERNFVRCDDRPIVYTHILKIKDGDCQRNHLSYGHADDLLTTEFIPDKLIMLPKTGRVYHPAADKVGSIGLVRSKLAIELSKHFVFNNGENMSPTHIDWDGKSYLLDQDWYCNILENNKRFC